MKVRPLLRDYLSQEIENKFRAERKWFGNNSWEATYGVAYEYVKYNNRTDESRFDPATGGLLPIAYATDFKAHKYGAFATGKSPAFG